MPVNSLAVREIKHSHPGRFHLTGQNCFFAVEKRIFIKEIDLLQERHANHEAATADFMAVMIFTPIVNINQRFIFGIVTKEVANPLQTGKPTSIRLHRILMVTVSVKNISGSNRNFGIVTQYYGHFFQIISLRELHIRIADHRVFKTFFCSITQADIISGIVPAVFWIGNKSTTGIFAQRLHHQSVIIP